ncbi:MAG: histidinol-phosphatase [Deltaproteobacteria bacterium]|nr:histidinol-phosphatase [Deltaproteobacteria bacterium]
MAIDDNSIFSHGSRWLRADFHLHTRADKEFSYSGDDDYYFSNYVDALEKAGIAVGVITNHNKFNFREFEALRKTANKKPIFLLPGVELSVNDGANGIHTLIVFSDQWLENGQDYINQFLNVIFEGKTPEQYENENGRSSFGLIETIKKLEGYHRDFFLIFAHVEDRGGLWYELDGGRLQEMGKDEFFIRRTLAFQKVRTHDVSDRKCRVKVQGWLGNAYPAEVEGSDCKAIDQVGQGKPCYLKIGDFTFGAVKYALLDHVNRIADKLEKHRHSHILRVSFDGGVLDGKTIHFSPELNTLIGIRGSGKSSILETLRYVFNIPFGDKALDTDYKKRLVDHVLGSGGKVTVQAVDRRGQRYEIRRINKERPDVYIDGVLQPGISIRETILHKPIYFGQKDLSATGEGFEKDLVEKLVGEKLARIRSRIDDQRQKVSELVNQLKKLSNMGEKKKEYEDKRRDAEFRLKFYKNHGVEEKLQKQVDFDADSRKCSQVVSFVRSYLADLEEFVNQYEDDLLNQRVYTSKQNTDFFEGFFTLYDKLIVSFGQIKKVLSDGNQVLTELKEKAGEFEKLRGSLKEEFAEIERRLSEQLRQSGAQAIRPDEFRHLRKAVDQASQMLRALDKQESSRKSLKQELLIEIALLNDLWLEEYKEIQAELDKVNNSHSSLEINAEFKGDKASFVAFMKDVFRGSRIRETTFSSAVKAFSDFGAMYKDFDKVKTEVGVSAQVFEKYFTENLSAFLTWQVPNRFTIEYRGKELKHHSLGQRASALILFVLSQQENDVFIIDQPEDDLDNQTIYEDVIKLIRSLKPKTQFVFATHNANFPVLGDAEQIVSCSYSDDMVHVTSGSIDCPKLQQEIVDIMEGGEEAFRQRRRRYEIWKPQSS